MNELKYKRLVKRTIATIKITYVLWTICFILLLIFFILWFIAIIFNCMDFLNDYVVFPTIIYSAYFGFVLSFSLVSHSIVFEIYLKSRYDTKKSDMFYNFHREKIIYNYIQDNLLDYARDKKPIS